MILVTGATGPVGRETVKQLVAAGARVRALTRDPSKANFDRKVEVVAGDLGKPDTLADALAGVERVFVLVPSLRSAEGWSYDPNIAHAAKGAGVKRLVRLSVIGAQPPVEDDPYTAYHLAGERAIEETGLPWTFLRPGQFMTNALYHAETIKSDGLVRQAYLHVRQAAIDPRDIAAVAATVLTSDGHDGKAYPLSGPEALSTAEQANKIGEALGRPITTIDVPPDVSRDESLQMGLPVEMVDGILRHMADESGRGGQVYPMVKDVTGREARTFDEWVRDNLDAFR